MEILRRGIRSVLGYDSGLYKAGATVLNFISIIKSDGLRIWWTLYKLQNEVGISESPCSIHFKNLKYPIFVRPGTEDVGTAINNVIREEYGNFSSLEHPEWMVDAGAYIGDTSAYFLSRFQKLKVISLEPNPESFELAKSNLQSYGERSILLKKGLFSNEQTQYFSGDQTGASIADTGIEIECTTIPALLDNYSIPFINILKIDIEGAEEELFSSHPKAWLERVGLLIIEFHGAKMESMISDVLKNNGFLMRKYRSVWYCQRDDK